MMSDDLTQVPAIAIVNEGEYRERLTRIAEEISALKKQRAELQAATDQHAGMLAQVRNERAEIDKARDDLKAREEKLAADTENLSGAIKSLNEEKTRWEAVRQTVEGEHRDRATDLDSREQALLTAKRNVLTSHTSLSQREVAVEALEKKHAAAAEHARKLIDALA